MWRHRNNIEHVNDVRVETTKVDEAIEAELYKGGDNCCAELEQLLGDFRQMDLNSKSLAYKKRWLRGVQAERGRATRRGLSNRIMQRMRDNMRQFLQH